MHMFKMIDWLSATGSKINTFASRGRVTLYAGGAASRRLSIGVDSKGMPVLGIPECDRPAWVLDTTWNSIVFATNCTLPENATAAGDHGLASDYIGLIGGMDNTKHQFSIWLPVNTNTLSAIMQTSEKFRAMKDGPVKTIRIVCYENIAGKLLWAEGSDINICSLRHIHDVPIDEKAIWVGNKFGGKSQGSGDKKPASSKTKFPSKKKFAKKSK